jgi:hypothetical protein
MEAFFIWMLLTILILGLMASYNFSKGKEHDAQALKMLEGQARDLRRQRPPPGAGAYHPTGGLTRTRLGPLLLALGGQQPRGTVHAQHGMEGQQPQAHNG